MGKVIGLVFTADALSPERIHCPHCDKVGQREVNSFLLIIPEGAGGMSYLPPSQFAGAEW